MVMSFIGTLIVEFEMVRFLGNDLIEEFMDYTGNVFISQVIILTQMPVCLSGNTDTLKLCLCVCVCV